MRFQHLPGAETLLERYRSSCEIRPGLPEAEVHSEVLYTPASRGVGIAYEGALFDRNGARIAAADLVRERRTLNGGAPVAERARVGGTGLYLGWLLPVYGHALLESLARCWNQSAADFAVYHAPRRKRVPAFLRAHLDRLGVGEVVVPTEPTRFERLIVPWPAFEIRMRAYRGFADLFPRPAATDPRPVYVSRSRLATDARAVAGEAALEPALAAAGHRVVHPGTLSTAEQLEVFASHRRYAGVIGSAMHNILFNAAPEVVYLTDGEPNLNFLMCDELVGADSLYVSCLDHGELPDLGRQMPLRPDLARAADALGVSVDAGLQRSVDERHREMWAEVRLKQGLSARDRSALRDVREHHSGPIAPRLARLARELLLSTSRRGRISPRSWASGLGRPARH